MLHTGLVSVTFRQLKAEEIIKLVVEAGLEGIEWGGDIHVPHGEIKRAVEVGKKTEDAGLLTAAYGSYYVAGYRETGAVEFEKVLESAVAIKAPTIRVWAGDKGSGDANIPWRNIVVEDSRRIASLAEAVGITISFEYHRDTLTDTTESAYAFFKELNHKNVRSYWQKRSNEDKAKGLEGLNTVTPWLSNIHVNGLEESFREWQSYTDYVKKLNGDRFIMLEFVKNNCPECFLKNAGLLKQLTK